jgi:hypothetical protein
VQAVLVERWVLAPPLGVGALVDPAQVGVVDVKGRLAECERLLDRLPGGGVLAHDIVHCRHGCRRPDY